jgi:hypothetical protein
MESEDKTETFQRAVAQILLETHDEGGSRAAHERA